MSDRRPAVGQSKAKRQTFYKNRALRWTIAVTVSIVSPGSDR